MDERPRTLDDQRGDADAMRELTFRAVASACRRSSAGSLPKRRAASGWGSHTTYADGGDAARACGLLERWGMAGGRWRHVAGASLSRAVPLPWGGNGGSSALLMSCAPAFIKAKWMNGAPQPAKVYLQCAAHPKR